LTPEEQQKLIDNQIDPAKVSEALTKAQNGDKESIMSLAQLYYNMKNMDKVKQILQYGVDRNYPEAIYNLAVILKQEGNTAEANKLIAKLPRGAVTRTGGAGVAGGQRVRQIRMRPGAEAYNRGVDLIKAKRYKEAKAEFEKAYNAGIKEADVRVALLNKELKNDSEALKWFKKAANRGVKEANYEIGAILYDGGKQSESRPYLLKAYNSGNKAMAMPIAMSYHQQNNMSEALKWYKIAAKNGDKNEGVMWHVDTKKQVIVVRQTSMHEFPYVLRDGVLTFDNDDYVEKNSETYRKAKKMTEWDYENN